MTPSQPSEPENYSLDQMLERLQGKPTTSEEDDAGELVTRADGSQAIKVRKRKRRSKQPLKEAAKKASRMRAIQISCAVILLILLFLTIGSLLVYTNSSIYQDKIVSKFNQATGAKVKLEQMQVGPTGTNAYTAKFEWPDGNLLKSLQVNNIRAQALMGGAIGNSWRVNEVSASTGELQIGASVEDQPSRFFPETSGSSAVSINRLGIESFKATVGEPSSPFIQLLKSEASFYPESKQGHPTLRLFRGELHARNWPMFRIDRGMIEFRKNETEILSLRLFHETDNNGNIELSGKFNPHDLSTERSLLVKLNSFNLNGVIGNSLGHLVAGRVDSRSDVGTNRLEFSSSNPEGRLQVAFVSSPNTLPRLNNFSFLSKLSQVTDNPWYLDPLFHDGCSGILHRENGTVRITELSLTAKNQLQVTGELAVAKNDELSGTLHVGLPEAIVAGGRNPALAKMFKESRDGLLWVTVKISGTAGRPVDNFTELVQATSGLPAPTAPGQAQDLFETLTAPLANPR